MPRAVNPAPEPDCWLHPDVVVAGEELTNDYATSTADPAFRMPCGCGSPLCRGEVTGEDWRRADLRSRYGDHWVPALLTLIRA